MIVDKLFEMKDESYKEFNKKLIPNVNEDLIIGVRTPELRKYAKEIFKSELREPFLQSLPHKYYEENNLHAFIIEEFRDFERVIYETERFLPYIDNWATCDMFRPKIYKKNADKLEGYIRKWIKSNKVYTLRYAIGLLLSYYLDSEFSSEYLSMVASVKSQEYYVNMMIAWYFQIAIAKQYNSAISYLENRRLDKWTHNKAIQKCIESYKISVETKEYLRGLKIR